jgi:HEAT repeat protein
MDERTLRERTKGTALERARRSGMLRNVMLLLGSGRVEEAVAGLARRLADADPTVRWAAAWALRRIGSEKALEALRAHHDDPDEAVRGAIASGICLDEGTGC